MEHGDVGICRDCKDNAVFLKTDEHGDELAGSDPLFEETEALSECCSVEELGWPWK